MNRQRILAEARTATGAGLIGIVAALALVYGIDHDPDLAPTPPTLSHHGTPAPESFTITEDDPEWNCLIMGDGQCGPEWTPIPETLYSGLGMSDDETCLWRLDGTTQIVCTDGQVFWS